MIIDDKYKFVYQHIPKTGGTFVNQLLHQYINTCTMLDEYSIKYYADKDVSDREIELSKTKLGAIQHLEFRFLKDDVVKDYKLIISVRHPVERILSLYADMYFNRPEEITEKPDIEEFVLKQTKGFNEETAVGRKIENAIRLARENAGYEVIRFETLKHDVLDILTRLNIPIGPTFFKDLMVNGKVSRFHEETPPFSRVTSDEIRLMVAEKFYSHKSLYKKLLEHESWLMEYYYNNELKDH